MPLEVTYAIAPRGLATSFEESELPPQYALKFRNRSINAVGEAEKRQGIVQLGTTIAGSPTIDAIHELTGSDGTATLFASGQGSIYSYSESLGTWSQVHTGLDTTAKLSSVQMGDKLIFANGVDANFFTTNGTTFTDLKALIEVGAATAGTDQDSLENSDIANWVTDTDVAINDLLNNLTTGGQAIINAIATASVGHTEISTSAAGIGLATASQASGDRYEIIDLVELNVIPTDDPNTPDNTATAAVGTSATGIRVSAVANWVTTDVRVGDYIRNTTKAAATQVTAITTAALGVVGVSGQTNGDSLVFLKSAMPLSRRPHVHFGRLYLPDNRDRRLIRITGAGNPQDMTTDAGTLDSSSFSFGNLQPKGDVVQGLESFQRFFCIGGRSAVYLYEGIDPIADTSAASTDFSIIGVFPKGLVAEGAMVSLGNDLVFITPDGAESVSLVFDASSLGRANLSEPLRKTLRDSLQTASDVQVVHYPRRSWLMLKVDNEMYVFNYTPFLGENQLTSQQQGTVGTNAGSWSVFDGKFTRQNAYFVRGNSTLVCGGAGGKVYQFDQDTYDDDGEIYTTEYQTGWLTGDEPKRRQNIKQGHSIRPIFNSGDTITYTIQAEGAFSRESSESITVDVSGGGSPIGLAVIGTDVIGGSSVQDRKFALRWRGKEVRITFTTSDARGPDVISRFTLYVTKHGKR